MKFFILLFFITIQAHAMTFSDWQLLTDKQKSQYLYENWNNGSIEINLNKNKVTKNLFSSADQKKIEKIVYRIMQRLSNYEPDFDTEVQDDMYSTVGPLSTNATLFFSSDKQFIGARIDYLQSGCSTEDNRGFNHYDSIQEAEADKCFDNDVSWSGESITDEKLSEIYSSEYMEWTGH